ncbi:hypothetical protein Tco_1298241 [Tanacetum coccineum]
MITLLQGIDREYLQTLWKLVKTKHGDLRLEDEHERVLWGDLKVMFEPDIRSDVWRNLQGYKVTIGKLIDSSRVHFLRLHFVEEPMEIMDHEFKRLKQSRIPIIKVRWNSRRGPEFTWEREDQFQKKYPHLFTKVAPSTSTTS